MKTRNSAFYREICILRILVKMGYIDKKALPHIIDIAAKDYNSDLIILHIEKGASFLILY